MTQEQQQKIQDLIDGKVEPKDDVQKYQVAVIKDAIIQAQVIERTVMEGQQALLRLQGAQSRAIEDLIKSF